MKKNKKGKEKKPSYLEYKEKDLSEDKWICKFLTRKKCVCSGGNEIRVPFRVPFERSVEYEE